ncbi:MAG: sulfite exporter TauE/SafE family protein [Ornithinimicrobium sp.]
MLTPTALAVLALAAFLVGLAKTSLGGLATVSVALFALVLPARESTAALLLVFLVGDAIAVTLYRGEADWTLIRSMLPGILPGLVVGTVVLAVASDDVLRRGIGAVLVALVALQLLVRRRSVAAPEPWSLPARATVGLAAGFTTMVANAAGPVMALYLVGQGVEKRRFVGTAAWFFLGVNLAKLPFSVGLGLVSPSMLATTALLAPAVALGAFTGLVLLDRLRQHVFEFTVLAASALSAVPLLLL